MKSKPVRASLPGRFGKMTERELDRESDRYNTEFSATRAKRIPNARLHPRKRGRPSKPAEEKAARVLITMDPDLLAATDAAATRSGLTRAGLVQQAVRRWLKEQQRAGRKSA